MAENKQNVNDKKIFEEWKDARHQSSMAKLNGAIMANQVVDRVLQIHGGEQPDGVESVLRASLGYFRYTADTEEQSRHPDGQ